MSQVLMEVYRLLHNELIRMSPYHPQTDGLAERFNQTLKAMLKKAVSEDGKDWDCLIPYLLFAYREVPQSSTRFSLQTAVREAGSRAIGYLTGDIGG